MLYIQAIKSCFVGLRKKKRGTINEKELHRFSEWDGMEGQHGANEV